MVSNQVMLMLELNSMIQFKTLQPLKISLDLFTLIK